MTPYCLHPVFCAAADLAACFFPPPPSPSKHLAAFSPGSSFLALKQVSNPAPPHSRKMSASSTVASAAASSSFSRPGAWTRLNRSESRSPTRQGPARSSQSTTTTTGPPPRRTVYDRACAPRAKRERSRSRSPKSRDITQSVTSTFAESGSGGGGGGGGSDGSGSNPLPLRKFTLRMTGITAQRYAENLTRVEAYAAVCESHARART